MLTISKPLSSGQAQAYHRDKSCQCSGQLLLRRRPACAARGTANARTVDLKGEVNEDHFARLADGQHPLTGAQLVQHRARWSMSPTGGEEVKTMEHRAGWDATYLRA